VRPDPFISHSIPVESILDAASKRFNGAEQTPLGYKRNSVQCVREIF
jgi:hypothetical protein